MNRKNHVHDGHPFVQDQVQVRSMLPVVRQSLATLTGGVEHRRPSTVFRLFFRPFGIPLSFYLKHYIVAWELM